MFFFQEVLQHRMTFGDARLYISVRPALEYTLPAAGARVRDVLLGDATTMEAVEALQQCLPTDKEEKPSMSLPLREEGSSKDEDDDDTSSQAEVHLETKCARACSLTHEYLQDISSKWATHLTEAHTSVRRAVRHLESQRAEAYRVHARYRATHTDIVDQELRMELTRLRTELDRTLDRVRETSPPSCERPSALTEATHDLREAFASSYGTLPTRDLLTLKRRFEHDLSIVEQRLAQAFVTRVVKLLRSTETH